MEFGLERVGRFLNKNVQTHLDTSFIFESRGKKEDNALELEFRRVCDVSSNGGSKPNYNIVFAHKRTNSCGLQLADLIARPIGRKILMPKQENRAYEIIEPKFRHSDTGKIDGWGLKVFP